MSRKTKTSSIFFRKKKSKSGAMEKKVKYVFMIRALKTQKLCVTDIGIITEKSKLKVKHEEIFLCCFPKIV